MYVANMRLPTERAHGAQVMKACEAFAKAGHDVELVVPNRRNAILEDPFAYYGVERVFTVRKIWCLDIGAWGRFAFVLYSLLFGIGAFRRITVSRPGVVYARDEVSLAPLSFLTRVPLFWESHDGSWGVFARYVAKRVSGIVAVTEGGASLYRENGVAPERIIAVPNGIDLEDFAKPESKSAARRRLGIPEDEIVVLYIGSLGGWKGVETLLRAASHLGLAKVSVIGGSDEEVRALTAMYPAVRFLGSRPYRELPHNQAAADVLVVPNTGKDPISARFTSPLKLIAHLASERPVVVSDLPTTRAIADEAAFFVPPDDERQLVAGIELVLSDRDLSLRLAARAKERAGEYTWTRRARTILAFISSRNLP